ncbi:hypothetical protein scyTo_0019448, partial [Scyliorhinus torazame]|nr:hypothetical protein [Scyliorhinus torazame]
MDGAELIIEGLLNISWGLRRPIRLQMHDDNERMCFSGSKLLRVGQQTGLYKKGPMPQTLTNSSEAENESTNTDDFPQNMSSSSIA